MTKASNRNQASKDIQQALLAGEVVTSVEAATAFGYWRLAALIHRLRRRGWPIEANREHGNGLAHYSLPPGWTPSQTKTPTE